MSVNLSIKVATGAVAFLCLTACASISANADRASSTAPVMRAEQAPPELEHWGQLGGVWSIADESLQKDGKTWKAGQGAEWRFGYVLDGWMIQDEWISPAPETKLDDETKRQRGVNLRIYNTAEKKWVLTWLTASSSKAMTLTAQSDENKIVMLADDKNPQGKWSRITFFDMTESSFEWTMEWSSDQENWFTVYKIHGTRKS